MGNCSDSSTSATVWRSKVFRRWRLTSELTENRTVFYIYTTRVGRCMNSRGNYGQLSKHTQASGILATIRVYFKYCASWSLNVMSEKIGVISGISPQQQRKVNATQQRCYKYASWSLNAMPEKIGVISGISPQQQRKVNATSRLNITL